MDDKYLREEEEEAEEEDEDAAAKRLQLIQTLFKSFERERQIKEDFNRLNPAQFIADLTIKEEDQHNKRLESFSLLSTYSKDEENHPRLIEIGVLPVLINTLKTINQKLKVTQLAVENTLSGDDEDLRRSVCSTLAKLSDAEVYTHQMVAEGVVPPLVEFILYYLKNNIKNSTRKYASRCIFHIGESAFLREHIPRALESHSPEDKELFLHVILSDPVDSEERDYWDEMLQNTDLVLHQYKPGKAWYEPEKFSFCTKLLEENFEIIKKEALAQCVDKSMVPWPEKFLYKDGWNVLGMYAFQNKLERPCSLCPFTTSVLEKIPGLQTALFSTLKPRCHIKPHIGYYQYSEKILRVHMGIVVPDGCVIKVNGEEHSWEVGKCVVFDDTFRHEVWNPSYDTTRIVLMLDIAFEGNLGDRNQEFFAKSARQAAEFGTDALISRDLIDALVSFGAQENTHFSQRPEKYL